LINTLFDIIQNLVRLQGLIVCRHAYFRGYAEQGPPQRMTLHRLYVVFDVRAGGDNRSKGGNISRPAGLVQFAVLLEFLYYSLYIRPKVMFVKLADRLVNPLMRP